MLGGVAVAPAGASGGGQPIVVGGTGSAALSQGASQGFEAGIVRFNKSGGLDGRKIKYLGFSDDGFSPATALSNVQKLVQEEHVFAIAPYNSDVATDAVTALVKQSKTPIIGWGVSLPFVSDPWAWGINGNYALGTYSSTTQLKQLAQAIGVAPGKVKLALIANAIPAGGNTLKVAAAAAKSLGMKIVYDEAVIPAQGTTNYAPFAEAIQSSGATAIYTGLGASDVLGLSAALHQTGYTGAIENGVAYFPGQLSSQPSEEAALQNGYVSSSFPVDENKTPATKQAQKDLKSIGQPPNLTTGVSIGYWSAQLLIQALEATKAKVGSAAKVTPAAVERVVNAGFTYKPALAGGMGAESFPEAELKPGTCATMVQVKGAQYVQKVPFRCDGKLVPVG